MSRWFKCTIALPASTAVNAKMLHSLVLLISAGAILSGCEKNLNSTAQQPDQGYVVSDIVLDTANE
jgi:uncharacterized lipoprotein YajG